ncbi:hypothetical protein CC86DRAFT_7156 [Ophiobolus disseminans]|uniref:Uncharacterized protein n=1 Tax=Ophiobolus disseminans TaxID=1469910 RepID=A0A6A7AKJ0_9PLEO|nr:hypothetical protein CC86DRAFT_7156 [Ophiobolus disseminans]
MGKSNEEPTMTRLEDLRLLRELKEMLLEYVTTIFTPTHPAAHGFALLVCRHAGAPSRGRAGRSEEFIVIRAIVYLSADKSVWKVVAESSRAQFGILPALQEFSKDLEREMGRMSDRGGGKRKEKRWEKSGLFGEEDGEKWRDEV